MYATELIETEVKLNEEVYTIDLELTAQLIDASFSHEFGVESRSEVEIVEMEIQTVYDSEGDVITSRSIIAQIENRLDIEDYNNLEFDFSE